MSTFYNPNTPQDRDSWLSLTNSDRMRVVKSYYNSVRIKTTSTFIYLHVLVEDQIAFGTRPVIRALDRLQHSGLVRHEAITTIAAVFKEHYRSLPHQQTREEQSHFQLNLNSELDALAAPEK